MIINIYIYIHLHIQSSLDYLPHLGLVKMLAESEGSG